MVFFNYSTMQMAAKVVYYGPGLCGKTTNLQHIYSHTSSGSRGEMVSLETETDRTLFFDLLPLEVGKIQGFKTRIQLYTVPGQVFYNTTRKLVLKGVDGIVFVADSQRAMEQANVESLENLRENLDEIGLTFDDVPVVLQYNKRDLQDILTVDEMETSLNSKGWPSFEASALTGEGVFDTLRGISKLTLIGLKRRLQETAQGTPVSRSADTPTPASTTDYSATPTVDVVDEPPRAASENASMASPARAREGDTADRPSPTLEASEDTGIANESATPERPASSVDTQAEAPSPETRTGAESVGAAGPRSRRGSVDILAELEKIRQQAKSQNQPEETNGSSETSSGSTRAFDTSAEEDPSGAFEVPNLDPTSDPTSSNDHLEAMPGMPEIELDDPEDHDHGRPEIAASTWPDRVNGNGRREIDHSFNFQPSAEALERASSLSFRLRIEDSNRSVVDTFDEAIQVSDAASIERLLLNLRIALDPSDPTNG